MIEVKGKYCDAKIFTDLVDQETISQVYNTMEFEFCKDSNLRIMPDCHKGAGCTIGTTMKIINKVVPNLVGVDIGCGMYVVELGNIDIDLKRLDEEIRKRIPSGFSIMDKIHKFSMNIPFEELRCKTVDIDRAKKSIGTLGGGNHFIEIDVDEDGNKYLVIHSGSRNLGKQLAEYYQKVAVNQRTQIDLKPIIERLKSEGKEKEIENHLKTYKTHIPRELCWLEGQEMQDYLHDMKIVQNFAYLNRMTMADIICTEILKAMKGEILIIPINMRDGSLICIGKGNPDWNYSAPHGAGRLMSRSQAKQNVSMKEFEDSMKGIYTTSVNKSTLDESPMAYKPIESIVENIKDTVEIINVIKPIYNFKAGDDMSINQNFHLEKIV